MGNLILLFGVFVRKNINHRCSFTGNEGIVYDIIKVSFKMKVNITIYVYNKNIIAISSIVR